jgi:hypothetical protein
MDVHMAQEILRAEQVADRGSACPVPPAPPSVRLPAGHRTALPDARRADRARLEREVQLASQSPIVNAVLETSDSMLLVLNRERQIVAFNGRVPRPDGVELRGLRPGEALGCVNAAGGCGASPACETCGALGAMVGCQLRRVPVEAECTIRSEAAGGIHYELHARAAPVELEGTTFTVLSLRDVSAEKRRQVLEQLFFHDVLNTVAGLRSWSALLERAGDPRRAAERIDLLSRQIEREIRDQRALLEAESGTLTPQWSPLDARAVQEDVAAIFAEHRLAKDRRLELDPAPPELAFTSDRALVIRTLVNAVCNALEATPPGGAVRCWAEPAAGGGVRFHVQNPGAMAADVQARVFQRSFSTKAARGRGLGTYSMKLFGERCLGGKVSFVSDDQRGTVFTLALPPRPAA